MSRRNILRTVFVGGATGLAAISIGETPAFASDCSGHCGPTPRCKHCRPTECPHGYILCKGSRRSDCFNKEGYRCEWPSGMWIACTGLGHGYGYKICKDCIFRHRCHDWCTCLTDCLCCNCKTGADFKEEQHRQMLAAT